MKQIFINTKLCIRLTLVALYILAKPIYAENYILEDKICIKRNESGECMGYYLPYKKNRTHMDYQAALREELGVDLTYEALNQIISYTSKIQQTQPEVFLGYISENQETLIQNNGWKGTLQHTYMTLALLNIYGKKYFGITENQANRIAHDLYVATHDLYLNRTPSFHFATQNPAIKKQLEFVENAFSHGATPRTEINSDEDGRKMLIAELFTSITLGTKAPFHWSSLDSTKTLIRLVPELRFYPALQVEAGAGRLANMLKMENIDIIATDIDADNYQGPPFSYNVMAIPPDQAIRQYATERKLILIDHSIENTHDLLTMIKDAPGETITVLIENRSFPTKDYESDFHIEKRAGHKKFEPSVFQYKENQGVDIYILRRKGGRPWVPEPSYSATVDT